MHKRTVKFIALILFMIAAIFFALSMDLRHILNPSTIQEFVNQFQILGPVVFILLYMVGQVLLIPATPLSIVAGVIFGAFQGSIYAIVGATLGSIVAFSIARYMGEEFISHLLKSKFKPLANFNKKLEEDGFGAVIFFRLPIFPHSLTNYLFGLTKTPLWKFTLATVIILPLTTPLLAYLGSSLTSLNLVKILTSTILLIIVIVTIPIFQKRHLDNNHKKNQSLADTKANKKANNKPKNKGTKKK